MLPPMTPRLDGQTRPSLIIGFYLRRREQPFTRLPDCSGTLPRLRQAAINDSDDLREERGARDGVGVWNGSCQGFLGMQEAVTTADTNAFQRQNHTGKQKVGDLSI